MCVSEVSADVPQAASRLAKPRVHGRPVAKQFWGSFGRCRPGARAFDAELVTAMQDLLYGVCWLPGRPLSGFWDFCTSPLWGSIGTPRMSTCPVNAATQLGNGETAQQAAVMYHGGIRLSSFVKLSAVFLHVCLLSAAHLRGKSGEATYVTADGFAICVFPSGFQCHRSVMQSTGEGNSWLQGRTSGTKVEGGISLVGLTPWSLGQGLHLRLPTLRLSCHSPSPKRNKPRNHTAATGQDAHSAAVSFKRAFSHHPSPVHLPSKRKVKNSFLPSVFPRSHPQEGPF